MPESRKPPSRGRTPPHLVEGDADKFAAFKLAHAALAASGTVTLELALAATPMVVAYRVDALAAHLRFLLKVPVGRAGEPGAGHNAFPEYLQEDCTRGQSRRGAVAAPARYAGAPRPDRPRSTRIPERMALDGATPSDAAADVVLHYAEHGRQAAMK